MIVLEIDTAERAASPTHDCGIWRYHCDEANEAKVRAAFTALGFTPREATSQPYPSPVVASTPAPPRG